MKQCLPQQRLRFSSAWMLSTFLALTACGGGSTDSDTVEKFAQTTSTSALDPIPASLSAVNTSEQSFHNTSAFVKKADVSQKSLDKSDAVRKIVIGSKTAKALEQNPGINLGKISASEVSQINQNNQKNTSRPNSKAYQIGIGRPISSVNQTKSLQSLLTWSTSANGNSEGTANFTSADAAGIRLGIVITSLPDNALIRTYGSGDTSALEITGTQINQTLASNIQADGDSAVARTYWLPMTQGATANLTIELPAGTSTNGLAIEAPSLIHFVKTALQANDANALQKSACPNINPDVNCTVPLPPAANAVGLVGYIDSGSAYVCNGTLVADKAASGTPYFITANHCISNQTAASTAEVVWFARSSACNSSSYNPNAVVTTGGATLLYTQTYATANIKNPVGTDTTLLKLNTSPPNGVMYVGWTNQQQSINPSVNLTALHNPLGEIMRQSTGTISGLSMASSSGITSSTSNTSLPMYTASWNAGITETGSSGSGLFKDGTTSNPQIVGQLFGGYSSCTATTSPDYYGRFDLAYQNGMIEWLNPGYRMVFRFFNTGNGAHFFSASVDERNNVRNTLPALNYEGPAFSVASAPGSNLNPVYRFYNTKTGAHFYTISESERANVIATLPWYNPEGIAWYARRSDNPGTDTIPIYRFYLKTLGTHFYTASASERDYVIQNLSANYNYEGVAYQVWAPI